MQTTLVLLALALAAPPSDLDEEKRLKLVLMSLHDNGSGEKATKTVEEMVAASLSRDRRLEVISPSDMRAMMELEADKAMVGCGDDSCMAELASALGADLMAHGSLGALGDLTVLNLSLFDAREGRSAGRDSVQALRIEELPGSIDGLVAGLLGGALGGEVFEPHTAPTEPNAVMLWSGVGVTLVGVVTAAVFGAATLSDGDIISDFESPGAAKTSAIERWPLDVGLVGAGVGLAVIGSGVIAAAFVLSSEGT